LREVIGVIVRGKWDIHIFLDFLARWSLKKKDQKAKIFGDFFAE